MGQSKVIQRSSLVFLKDESGPAVNSNSMVSLMYVELARGMTECSYNEAQEC